MGRSVGAVALPVPVGREPVPHGRRVKGPFCGFIAALMGLGSPGIMGTTQYIEPHLAVVLMSAVVCCWSTGRTEAVEIGVLASLALWSLSRSGEVGDAVIAARRHRTGHCDASDRES